MKTGSLVLGIDTCGPSGSVALGRLDRDTLEVLGQTELAGRTYSATLVAALGELLKQHDVALRELGALLAVNGPGSFTGVRVGLSAVKGLAEPFGIPVLAVSRLEVLAGKAKTQGAGIQSAALDAHRHEVFLRVEAPGAKVREILAGRAELGLFETRPAEIAICDAETEELLGAAWPDVRLMRVEAPSAADALELAMRKIQIGAFNDVALLDGHYLRRSDAEIFGEPLQTVIPRT